MPNGWKIRSFAVMSEAQHVSSHAPVGSSLCSGLGCTVKCCQSLYLSLSLSLSRLKDKLTNGDTSPEEKKQEMEREKLPENTLVRENPR